MDILLVRSQWQHVYFQPEAHLIQIYIGMELLMLHCAPVYEIFEIEILGETQLIRSIVFEGMSRHMLYIFCMRLIPGCYPDIAELAVRIGLQGHHAGF